MNPEPSDPAGVPESDPADPQPVERQSAPTPLSGTPAAECIQIRDLSAEQFVVQRTQSEAWSFPSAHFVRMSCCTPDRLFIEFTTHVVEVSCASPERLLEEIFYGRLAELVSADADSERAATTQVDGCPIGAIDVSTSPESHDDKPGC